MFTSGHIWIMLTFAMSLGKVFKLFEGVMYERNTYIGDIGVNWV